MASRPRVRTEVGVLEKAAVVEEPGAGPSLLSAAPVDAAPATAAGLASGRALDPRELIRRIRVHNLVVLSLEVLPDFFNRAALNQDVAVFKNPALGILGYDRASAQ